MRKMRTFKFALLSICICVCLLLLLFVFLPKLLRGHVSRADSETSAAHKSGVLGGAAGADVQNNSTASSTSSVPVFVPSYVSTPDSVKALYMTSWVASSAALRGNLVKLVDETELNTIVIDIKDYTGTIAFPVENPALKAYGSEEVRVKDMRKFIEELHQKGVYVIGRVAVFQDAYYVKKRPDLAVKNKAGTAVWKDRKGISWIDAGAKEYWDYMVLLARESHAIGFDEINFDYIRFPSDGNMQDISFPFSSTTPKAEVMRQFFAYLNDELVPPRKVLGEPQGLSLGNRLKISADLFGMVTTAQDDMGIGQLFEHALPYFDYVAPMVYPSHYPPTFQGYKNPAAYPYEVVKYAMQEGVRRADALERKELGVKMGTTTVSSLPIEHIYRDKLRPWLQDFDLGANYDAVEVRAQIKATYDVGLDSWMLWSASNKYTKGALEE